MIFQHTWQAVIEGKKQQTRIRITGLSKEDVRKISYEDAEAEGFESRKLFLDVWLSMHDKPIYEAYRSVAVGTFTSPIYARLFAALFSAKRNTHLWYIVEALLPEEAQS